jgi:ABC-2 type transport system ATP-binding protein
MPQNGLEKRMEETVEILNVDAISKSFGNVEAVKSLSFSLREGQLFGLLGPNGAGKTTTIRMIMEILLPDNGRIEIFGEPNSAKVRERLGYLPEERGLYKRMKVMETLGFFAELKGVKSRDIRRSAEQWMEKFELSKWRDHRIEELSRGMQQKLQFICTVLPKPRLVILDEPFTGLDPVNTNLLKDTMLELKNNGTTIIFSTHLMDQVEKLCESI